MVRTLYVDPALLDEKIEQSGLKIGYICDVLGLSRNGFDKKRKGIIPLKAVEVFALCSLLNITDNAEKGIIFSPKVEDKFNLEEQEA